MTTALEAHPGPAVGDWISYDRERYEPRDHKVTTRSGADGLTGCGMRLSLRGIGGLSFAEIRPSDGTRARCTVCAARGSGTRVGTADLAEELRPYSVTYRQLDYWIRAGYVQGGRPGQGNPRGLTRTEAEVARRIALLRHLGVELPKAARYARVGLDEAPVWRVPLMAGTAGTPTVMLIVVTPLSVTDGEGMKVIDRGEMRLPAGTDAPDSGAGTEGASNSATVRDPCPRDTDGDGDCGRPFCPHCGRYAPTSTPERGAP